jgi:hypothetical protein
MKERDYWETTTIKGAVPWGVFAAYVAALASTAFLFVMALTGGIYLG